MLARIEQADFDSYIPRGYVQRGNAPQQIDGLAERGGMIIMDGNDGYCWGHGVTSVLIMRERRNT
jgi:hypothetical protein